MTAGFCSHCAEAGDVASLSAVAHVGLRFLLPACADRLNAMGMHLARVDEVEPRRQDRGRQARLRPGIGRRLAVATLRALGHPVTA